MHEWKKKPRLHLDSLERVVILNTYRSLLTAFSLLQVLVIPQEPWRTIYYLYYLLSLFIIFYLYYLLLGFTAQR